MSGKFTGRQSDAPRSILMLKGHSAGIGDLLRSSAAWRALQNGYPGVRLHLWFLTREPGYPSEELIRRHHLLSSFHVSAKREGWPGLLAKARALVGQTKPEMIIDFEPAGIRTSLLTMWMRLWARCKSLGIAQVPMRKLFYSKAAPSRETYAQRNNLPLPLEYTERDFVALAALGIQRNGLPIELRETPEGEAFRKTLQSAPALAGKPLLGINIGCGTPDALPKRPELTLLGRLAQQLCERHGFGLLLTGAPYEQEVNRQFLERLRLKTPAIDLAGKTNLLELTGAIAACRLFISSDSGPYHMAVGLGVPTLALFKWSNREHYHEHRWVRCLVAPGEKSYPEALQGAEDLLTINY